MIGIRLDRINENVKGIRMILKKRDRQNLILNILTQEVVDSQEELVRKIQEAGYEVTQATISRDIKELRIVRRADKDGRNRYQVMREGTDKASDGLANGIQGMLSEITRVAFMISIRTTPGSGNRLAALIDAGQLPEVVSTIAGHDTIHILCHSETDAQELEERLTSWL